MSDLTISLTLSPQLLAVGLAAAAVYDAVLIVLAVRLVRRLRAPSPVPAA